MYVWYELRQSNVKLSANNQYSSRTYLNRNEIDIILVRIFKEFTFFTHEDVHFIFNLLKFFFRKSSILFTPFYDDGNSLNNQIRKGLVCQISILPPRFIVNSSNEYIKLVEKKSKEICGKKYTVLEEFIKDVKNKYDEKSWYRHMLRAAVAHEKIPEEMKIKYIMNSELKYEEACYIFKKINEYVERFNGSQT